MNTVDHWREKYANSTIARSMVVSIPSIGSALDILLTKGGSLGGCPVTEQEFNGLVEKVRSLASSDTAIKTNSEIRYLELVSKGQAKDALEHFNNQIWANSYNSLSQYRETIYLLDLIVENNQLSAKLDNNLKAYAISLISLCQSRSGYLEGAIENAKSARKIYQSTRNTIGLRATNRSLIDCYIANGRLREASVLIDESINEVESKEKSNIGNKIQRQKGRLLSLQGKCQAASDCLLESYSHFQHVSDPQEQVISCIYLVEHYITIGEHEEAKKYLEEAQQLNTTLNSERDNIRIKLLHAQYWLSNGKVDKCENIIEIIDYRNLMDIEFQIKYHYIHAKFLQLKKHSGFKGQLSLGLELANSGKYNILSAQLYGLHLSSNCSISALDDSTLNLSYLLKCKEKKYILKQYREIATGGALRGQERTIQRRINAEHIVLKHLNKWSIEAPQLIRWDRAYGILARSYILSKPIDRLLPIQTKEEQIITLRAVGSWVRDVGAIQLNDSEISTSPLYTIDNILQSAKAFASLENIKEAKELIKQAEHYADQEQSENIGFVWGSCSIDNIYYDQTNKKVIGNDFEFSCYGDTHYDLGRMAMSIMKVRGLPHRELIKAFIQGYGEYKTSINLIYLWAGIAVLINAAWGNMTIIGARNLLDSINVELFALS